MSHISKGDVHAYLDGALGAYPEEAARHIRGHLDACRDCAQLLEDERRLRQEADAILAASTPRPVEVAPLEELLARAAESDHEEPAQGAEGSERKARPLVGGLLYSLRWAATVVIALGAGWMAREVTGPAGGVINGAASERGAANEVVATESVSRPIADQERLERDVVGGLAEAETLRESQAAVADRLAEVDAPPESQAAVITALRREETRSVSPGAVAVGGASPGADRAAGGSDDAAVVGDATAPDNAAVLDQVQRRQRAASAVAEVVPADANARARAAEPSVETARLSDEQRASALSISAADSDRQDGASVFGNAPPGASASASLSSISFLVPGLPVLDMRVAPEADGRAGEPGGLVVVTQELEDGRVIELRFVPLVGSDVVRREVFQERNNLLGRTAQADWRTTVREVPGGVAVLSGPLTQRELEDLLDRVLGPR